MSQDENQMLDEQVATSSVVEEPFESDVTGAEYEDGQAVEADAGEEEGHLVPGDEDERDAGLHEEILSQETVWRGKIFDIGTMEVKLPNGHCSRRDVVRHCGAVAVVALTENGKIAVVRQYRTALDRVTVEIPAGKMDPGEEPLESAKRELKEETGFVAGKIAYLTTIATSGGFTDELIHIFLATQLSFEGAEPDEDEFLNVDLVDVQELVDAVLDGKIEDAKTVVGALACDVMAHRLAADAFAAEDDAGEE